MEEIYRKSNIPYILMYLYVIVISVLAGTHKADGTDKCPISSRPFNIPYTTSENNRLERRLGHSACSYAETPGCNATRYDVVTLQARGHIALVH